MRSALVGTLLLGGAALAQEAAAATAPVEPSPKPALAARETAHVPPAGTFSIGVFAPLSYAVTDRLELRAQPLVFFVSPNLIAKVSHATVGGWTLAGEYGFSVPTLGMRLLRGYLFPTKGQELGWLVVPRAGVLASRGDPSFHVLTIGADVAVGVPLTKSEAKPLGAPAPLETLFAPATSGYRARVGLAQDLNLADWLRSRLYLDAYLHPANPSPLTVRAGAAFELRVGRQSRLSVGAVWWNSDQGDIDPGTGNHLRSNDFLPTADYVWTW